MKSMLGAFLKSDRLGNPRLTLILQGSPCSYGKCRFCPFAIEQSMSVKKIIETNRKIIEQAVKLVEKEDKQPERISIFNGGSFTELPMDTVIRLAPLSRGRAVDVELIPTLIDAHTVSSIKKMLDASILYVRTGFEVYDEKARFSLGKEFPNTLLFRIASHLEEFHKMGVRVLSYVLFGIDGIDEEKVRESVRKLGELLDGVICIRYRRYGPQMPREVDVSGELSRFLSEKCLLVDWTDNSEWSFDHNKEPMMLQSVKAISEPRKAPGSVVTTTPKAVTSVSKPKAAE